MQRRSLDALFSLGFFVGAAVLVLVGFVMANNASFTDHYIHHQLAVQRIAFPPPDMLSAEEKTHACIVENASRLVLTASQARCYADDFLAVRVDALAAQGVSKDALVSATTLQGVLLTTTAFDGIARHSRQIAVVAYACAGLLALLAVTGMVRSAMAMAEEPPVPEVSKPRIVKPRSPRVAA